MVKRLPLLLICLLFLVTRFFKIAEIPSSVYWDEASIGYNAYSVLLTGHDEWGETLPLHFRAFGEFKLPVYVYSVIPFIKIFGLSPLAVRLPSVIYSLGVVVLVYLLAKKLFTSELIGFFSAFFVVVTPWLFIFSRAGYEATAGLAFFLLAVWLFLLALKRPKLIMVSVAAHLLSIYSYNSFRLISPIFLVVSAIIFLIVNQRYVKKAVLYVIGSALLLGLSFIPIYRLYRFDAGGQRAQVVGLEGSRQQKVEQFFSNYLAHWSPQFLFSQGDSNPRSQMPGWGQVYWLSLPLVVVGLLTIVKRKRVEYYLPLVLLFLSPVPAALTRESPHALRSILMLPSLALIAGVGLQELTGLLVKYRTIVISAVVIGYLLCFEAYAYTFFNRYAGQSASAWQEGYKQVLVNYQPQLSTFKKVIVSDVYGQPYIFALFYLQEDPQGLVCRRRLNPPDKWGISTVAALGQFEFRQPKAEDLVADTLVFSDREIENGRASSHIKDPDGSTAFWVYQP